MGPDTHQATDSNAAENCTDPPNAENIDKEKAKTIGGHQAVSRPLIHEEVYVNSEQNVSTSVDVTPEKNLMIDCNFKL